MENSKETPRPSTVPKPLLGPQPFSSRRTTTFRCARSFITNRVARPAPAEKPTSSVPQPTAAISVPSASNDMSKPESTLEQEEQKKDQDNGSAAVVQMPKELARDISSTAKPLQQGSSIRKQLSEELLSKFESGGQSEPPQPTAAISMPSASKDTSKPGSTSEREALKKEQEKSSAAVVEMPEELPIDTSSTAKPLKECGSTRKQLSEELLSKFESGRQSEPSQSTAAISMPSTNNDVSKPISTSEQEAMKKEQEKSSAAVVEMPQELASDISSTAKPLKECGSTRKQLSEELLSKFESGGQSEPPQANAAISTPSTNNVVSKPNISTLEQEELKKEQDGSSAAVVQMPQDLAIDISSTTKPLKECGSTRKQLSEELLSKFQSAGQSEPPQPTTAISMPSASNDTSKPGSTSEQEALKKEQEKSSAAVVEMPQDLASDISSTTKPLKECGSTRKQLSEELLSKFESGGQPEPPQPTAPISMPSASNDVSKPEIGVGSTIKDKISLLFSSSLGPEELETETRKGTEAVDITGVKEKIKIWDMERKPECPMTDRTSHDRRFKTAAPSAPEISLSETSTTEASSSQVMDLPSKVSPAEEPTETPMETSEETFREDETSESPKETPGELMQAISTERDIQLHNRSPAITDSEEGDAAKGSDAQTPVKKTIVKHVRFNIVESDDDESEEESDASEDEDEQYMSIPSGKIVEMNVEREEPRPGEREEHREDTESHMRDEWERERMEEDQREKERLRKEETECERQMEVLWQTQREQETMETQKEERLGQEQEEREKERLVEERKEVRSEEIYKEMHKENKEKQREEEWETAWVTNTEMMCSEDLADFDYEDFSVKKPVSNIEFEDFSVKTKRWGSQAKVQSHPVVHSEPDDSVEKEEELVDPVDSSEENFMPEQVNKAHQEQTFTPSVCLLSEQSKEEEETEEEDKVEEEEEDWGKQMEVTTSSESTTLQDTDTSDVKPDQQQTQQYDNDNSKSLPEEPETDGGPAEENLFPSATELLDTSAQRSKAEISKKRMRSRVPRSVSVDQTNSFDWSKTEEQEENGSDSEDEQPRRKVVSPPPSMHSSYPAGLLAQLKKKTSGVGPVGGEVTEDSEPEEKESQNEEEALPRSPLSSSHSIARLPGAVQVLPPLGSTDGSAITVPSWMKEMKSKIRNRLDDDKV